MITCCLTSCRVLESELILSSGLHCSGKPVKQGTAYFWNRVSHSYENHTDSIQTILCVDRPKFEQKFEIELPTSTFSPENDRARRMEFHHDFWLQCIRNRTKFVFPGGLPGQTVELVCGRELPPVGGTMPDAVLVFARGTPDTLCGETRELTRESLLMVRFLCMYVCVCMCVCVCKGEQYKRKQGRKMKRERDAQNGRSRGLVSRSKRHTSSRFPVMPNNKG